MVNAQQWLDNNYPKEKRDEIKHVSLDVSNKNLEGFLDLSDFVNLGWLKCSNNKLTGLNLTRKSNPYGLYIANLECSNNELTTLDLSEHSKLFMLQCSNNKLTELDLSKNKALTQLYVNGNELTTLDFLQEIPNPEKITTLALSGNKVARSDLSIFSSFVNLEYLLIGNSMNNVLLNKKNDFYGSLEPLKNLKKLKCLEIENTDIDSGLEYLSKNCERIYCNYFGKAKVAKLAEELENYKKTDEEGARYYDIKALRTDEDNLSQKQMLFKLNDYFGSIIDKEIALATPQDLISQLIKELATKKELTDSEKDIICKINQILSMKKKFLIARQAIITQLQRCCDELEDKLIVKFAIVEEAAKTTSAVGKTVEKLSPVKIVEPIGDLISVFNSSSRRVYSERKGREFQIMLQEEPELKQLEQAYQELIKLANLVPNEEIELFSNDYQFYQVITNIWPNKSHVDAGDMKTTIEKLAENLKLLKKEVKEQKNLLKETNQKVNIDNSYLLFINKEQQLQSEIQQLKGLWEDLKNSAKTKLKSNHIFSVDRIKITQKREQWLAEYLTNPANLSSKQIKLLEDKLSAELLTELSETNNQLASKQKQLTELQNQTQALVVTSSSV